MSPRPNIRPVTYLDLESYRFHGNKPMGQDFTQPAPHRMDWPSFRKWGLTLVLWGAVLVFAWWMRG